MSPNRTGRGHPPFVGGNQSKGTITKALKLSIEMWKEVSRKIGKSGSFSDYVRKLIEADLKTTK
jgi:hypothetical protein